MPGWWWGSYLEETTARSLIFPHDEDAGVCVCQDAHVWLFDRWKQNLFIHSGTDKDLSKKKKKKESVFLALSHTLTHAHAHKHTDLLSQRVTLSCTNWLWLVEVSAMVNSSGAASLWKSKLGWTQTTCFLSFVLLLQTLLRVFCFCSTPSCFHFC